MKMRYLYRVLASGLLIGIQAVFVSQQGYAQEPTPSPVLSETTTAPTATATAEPLQSTVPVTSSVDGLAPSSTRPPTLNIPTTLSTTQNADLLDAEDIVSFDLLNFSEQRINAPSGLAELRFGLPANWELIEEAEMRLNFSAFLEQVGIQEDTLENFTSEMTLSISFNEVMLTEIPLVDIGEQTVVVPITTTALAPTRNDGRHELVLAVEGHIPCQSDLQQGVTIHPTSYFILPHRFVKPPIDLRQLPHPIYQRSFLPDLATIVVPDQPTTGEMQAGLAVAAGFGKMTNGNLSLSLIPVSQLTADVQENHHLIFVGNPQDFPLLSDATLPAPIKDSNYDAPGALPDDGIIQMAVSPWNDAKMILVAGGESDVAVLKAGQALSTGKVRVSGQPPDLAIIAEIKAEDLVADQPATDRTLADLGYLPEVMKEIGRNVANFEFEIPSGYTAEAGAYLDLTSNHSALLDYEQSGMRVDLNDQFIGTVRFSDETTSLTTVRLTIPRFAIQPGVNRLRIETQLIPFSECFNRNLDSIWLAIWPESLLHLPLTPALGETRAAFHLKEFPHPFGFKSTMNDTAFIIAPDNPAAWQVAVQIAYYLGSRFDLPLAEFAVAYGDEVTDQIRQNYHLVVIGRPSTLPLITELHDTLPLPFEEGSDIALERGMRVRSRIPPDVSLGYLQLFSAPWNRSRVILTILGSTDQAVEWAGTALTTPYLRNQLEGPFAIIDNEYISTGDLQPIFASQDLTATTLLEASVTPEAPDNSPEPSSDSPELAEEISPSAPIDGRPPWLLPTIVISTIFIFLVVGLVIISAWRRHSINKR